ncbi:hypothetical protein OG474_36375 [Kribbella sp. NBC_01505]
MPTATIDEFDLDIRVRAVVPVENYWPITAIGPCHTQDTTCAATLCIR